MPYIRDFNSSEELSGVSQIQYDAAWSRLKLNKKKDGFGEICSIVGQRVIYYNTCLCYEEGKLRLPKAKVLRCQIGHNCSQLNHKMQGIFSLTLLMIYI